MESNADLMKMLVTDFYERLLNDNSISFRFDDILAHDLESHLHTIADFWESLLFGVSKYKNNAMVPHLTLHEKDPFMVHDFETWLKHWRDAVHVHLKGELASTAIFRAESIANLMKHKMNIV